MVSQKRPFWSFMGRSTHCVNPHVMMYIPGVHTASAYWDTSCMWVDTHHLAVVSHVSKWGFPGSQPTKWCLAHLPHGECRLTTLPFSLYVTHGQTFHPMAEMVDFHGGPPSYHVYGDSGSTLHVPVYCGTLRVYSRNTRDQEPYNPTLYGRIVVPGPILYPSRPL